MDEITALELDDDTAFCGDVDRIRLLRIADEGHSFALQIEGAASLQDTAYQANRCIYRVSDEQLTEFSALIEREL